MPISYKLITALLAFTGSISIIVTGQSNPLMLIPAIGIFPGYYRFLKGRPQASKWAVGGLSIATALLFIFDSLFITGEFFIAVAHLTIIFQALKSFDLKDPWDHLQVYFMALLQIIISSELTRSIVFGFVFIAFLVTLIIAIVLSHFLREGTLKRVSFIKPLIFITALVIVATTVFFLSVPRVGGGFGGGRALKGGIKSVGFSGKVDFGSLGDVKLDHTVVMRVEVSGMKLPLYWRGSMLDYFDGTSWSNTFRGKGGIPKVDGRFVVKPWHEESTAQKIYAEPMDTDVVFGLGRIIAVDSDARLMLNDSTGALYLPLKTNRRCFYTAYSSPDVDLETRRWQKYLQLPDNVQKIISLSSAVVRKGKNEFEKAALIEDYLKRNHRYSLSVPEPPSGVAPIEDFLFNSKTGFCEHYATSMVLMLRAIGIPARIVTGFQGGEENTLGGYIIVRQSDAHAWVEALFGKKWAMFDPTPPSVIPPEGISMLSLYIDALRLKWYRYVVGFSLNDQSAILRTISMPFIRAPEMPAPRIGLKHAMYLLLALAVLIILFLLVRLRIKRYSPESSLYLKFRSRVRKNGGKIYDSMTPLEVMKEAERVGMDGNLYEFIKMYEDARFGGRKATAGDMKKTLKRALKKKLQ